MDKYVKLHHIQELIKLIKARDAYEYWTDSYERYDKKFENTVELLKRNAKSIDEL